MPQGHTITVTVLEHHGEYILDLLTVRFKQDNMSKYINRTDLISLFFAYMYSFVILPFFKGLGAFLSWPVFSKCTITL